MMRTVTATLTVLLGILSLVLLSGGCANCRTLPPPEEVLPPPAIQGNDGEYLCPFTSDGVLAEWVDMGTSVDVTRNLAGATGTLVGSQAFKEIPILGGLLGNVAGRELGKQAAISSCGGWELIKSSSDLSFNSVHAMAVYLYANHSSHPDYQAALKMLGEIYPSFAEEYESAVRSAARISNVRNDTEEPI